MLLITEFRQDDTKEDDLTFTGILEVEKPRVSFGNKITSGDIKIKCSSNGGDCGDLEKEEKCSDSEKEETEGKEDGEEECKKPKYHVKGLRLGFNYQPIISFK